MNEEKLLQCLHTFIFDDSEMRENDMNTIVKRVEFVFSDKMYELGYPVMVRPSYVLGGRGDVKSLQEWHSEIKDR